MTKVKKYDTVLSSRLIYQGGIVMTDEMFDQLELAKPYLLTRHEMYRLSNPDLWNQARLTPGSPATMVAEHLLKHGQHQLATQALFGTDRSGPFQNIDPRAYNSIFLALWGGSHPRLLEEIIEHSEWAFSESEEDDDLSLEVYPGEWFIIREPAATSVRWDILRGC
ncbi:hypothetical protein ACFL0Z_03815 [Patescibacteria group bacterium]